MDAGVSTKGLLVAGVSIGDDAWVTKFVAEKVGSVILDVGKMDHVHVSLSRDALLPEHAPWFFCPQHTHAPYFRFTL